MKIGCQINRQFWIRCSVLIAVWALASTALAGGVGGGGGGVLGLGGGGGMPWDSNIGWLRTSIRTVVCPAMIFVGIAMMGWDMFQEGEVKGFGKRGFLAMLAGGMAFGADSLVGRMTSGGLLL